MFWLDASPPIYPRNELRWECNTTSPSPSLKNERYCEDQSFNTAIGDHSLPPLSLAPQVDNE